MKILAISDIHGDKGLVKKVARIAQEENVDLILIAGDQTWFGQDAGSIVKPMTEKEILMIHGNHEDEGLIKMWEEIYPTLTNLHKKGVKKKDVGFFGSGTTDWGFKEEGSKVFKELDEAHKKIKDSKKKIMLTHSPPAGGVLDLLGFPGSYGVRKAIDKFKPDIVICGHIHEGGGLTEKIGNTKVINVARKPTIFEI